MADAREVVVIRADGSAAIGFGHVSRMLTVAAGLRAAGLDPRFATCEESAPVLARIRAAGFGPTPLPARRADDAARTRALIAETGARVVVTDLSSDEMLGEREAYAAYLSALKATGALLVCFDDLDRLPFAADVIVNPNVGADDVDVVAVTPTVRLAGPRYFPCPSGLARLGRERVVRPHGSRVLVSMGGGASSGVTVRVVEALARARVDALDVVALCGLDAEAATAVAARAGGFPGSLEVVEGLTDLSGHLAWADVAVTAAGLTKYETAATGLPGILLAQVEHQHRLAGRFAREGSAEYLGHGADVPEARITAAVESLLADHARRRAMSAAGTRLVDGRGVERLVEAVQLATGALR